MQIFREIKDKLEFILCISAKDIISDKLRGDNSLTYAEEVLRLANLIKNVIGEASQPKFVNSTDDMTNSNTIYVLSTNNHVYQWNGNSFVDTGATYGDITGVLVGEHLQVTPENYSTLGWNSIANMPLNTAYSFSSGITNDMIDGLPNYGYSISVVKIMSGFCFVGNLTAL